jgi:hypothetical protein
MFARRWMRLCYRLISSALAEERRSEGARVRKKSGVSGRLSVLQACMQAHSGIDCVAAKASPPAKIQNGPAALSC